MKWTVMGLAALGASAALGATVVLAAAEEKAPKAEKREVRVVRAGGAFLGVSLHDIDAEQAKRLALPDDRGALVRRVEEDSPAARAGLKADDVIVAFEGESVRSAAHLARLVRETPSGRSVEIAYLRGGARQQAQVTLGEHRMGRMMEGLRGLENFKIEGLDKLRDSLEGLELPEPPEPPEPPDVTEVPRPPRPPRPPRAPRPQFEDAWVWRDGFGMRPRLGIQVVELTDQLARYFKVEDGLLVSSVSESSAAAKAGLRAGDIIVKIDGERVSTRRDLVRRVDRDEAARQVTLSVQRDGRPLDVRVQIEPRRAPEGPTT